MNDYCYGVDCGVMIVLGGFLGRRGWGVRWGWCMCGGGNGLVFWFEGREEGICLIIGICLRG